MTKQQTLSVEYYRCWSGNQGDRGQWDTGFIDIPADTPDDLLDNAIREAVGLLPWPDEIPVFVGLYHKPAVEEETDA